MSLTKEEIDMCLKSSYDLQFYLQDIATKIYNAVSPIIQEFEIPLNFDLNSISINLLDVTEISKKPTKHFIVRNVNIHPYINDVSS